MDDIVKLANGKEVSWDEFSKWSGHKQYMNTINPNLGKQYSDVVRRNMSESKKEKIANGELTFKKGDDHPKSHPVSTPKGLFGSRLSAAQAYGVSLKRFSGWIKNPRFKDFKFIDDSFRDSLIKQKKREGSEVRSARAVITPLGRFDTVKSACAALEITLGTFYERLRDERYKSSYYYADGKGIGTHSAKHVGLKGGSNGSARSVMTPIGEFSTIKEAYTALKIDMTTLYKRLKDEKYDDYYYSDSNTSKPKKINKNPAKGAGNAASRAVMTPIGKFSTLREAHTALGISRPTLVSRLRDSEKKDYYYI